MSVLSFIDSQGHSWQVFEVKRQTENPSSVRPAFEDGWLCFQMSDGKKKRLAKGDYPVDWAGLSEDALEGLLIQGID